MTKSELGALIAKVFALFYLFRTIHWLAINSSVLFLPEGYEAYGDHAAYYLMLHIGTLVAYALLTVIFWFGSGKIGTLMAGSEDNKTVSSFSADQFMAGIFVAFGCILLTYAIPLLSELIAHFFKDETARQAGTRHLTEKYIRLFLYVSLSLLFILGARGLQNLVFKLRNFGHST